MEDANLTDTIPMEEQTLTTEFSPTNDTAEAMTEENTTAETTTAETTTAETTTAEEPVQPGNAPDTGEATTAEESTETDAPFLRVKFCHKIREMSKEETVAFAQKGLLYDKIQPIYHQLDYLAAQHGMTIKTLVDHLVQSVENQYREDLVDRFGDDATVIEDMMQLFRNRQKEKYEKIVADREKAEDEEWNNTRRQRENMLADQFVALQKEFPEIAAIADIPKEVMRLAADGKMDLTSAYLLHKHREERKVAAAAEQAAEQSKASTGTARTDGVLLDNAVMNALLKGIRT